MKYFIIAGEASGDLHGSNLMRELREADPAAEFCFLGGDLMQAQGGRMIKHYRQMAFMGIVAVLRNLRTVMRNMSLTRDALLAFEPDVLILIDYPGFNLRMAKYIKKARPHIPVFYYISPKIWAWKEWRVKSIRRYIDRMYTIFPFETDFYARHNYEVEYVGNPTVDSVCTRPNQDQTFETFRLKNNLPDKPIIALLAGSRKQEIVGCLPRMVEAAMRFSAYQVVVAGAPGIDAGLYDSVLKGRDVRIVSGQTYDLLQHARAAVVNSGTATLETALVGTPQVVVYHVMLGRLGYWAKEIVLAVKYVSLVNIVAQKEVVRELLAHLFTVNRVAAELNRILNEDNYREHMLREYALIREELGKPGAAREAARRMVRRLKQK